MIHYVDTMDTWNTVANGEVMRYALEQKLFQQRCVRPGCAHNGRRLIRRLPGGLRGHYARAHMPPRRIDRQQCARCV